MDSFFCMSTVGIECLNSANLDKISELEARKEQKRRKKEKEEQDEGSGGSGKKDAHRRLACVA